MSTLQIVRKTDGRVLFPFEGAPDIGPFNSEQLACTAAQEYGRELIAADLRTPER